MLYTYTYIQILVIEAMQDSVPLLKTFGNGNTNFFLLASRGLNLSCFAM